MGLAIRRLEYSHPTVHRHPLERRTGDTAHFRIMQSDRISAISSETLGDEVFIPHSALWTVNPLPYSLFLEHASLTMTGGSCCTTLPASSLTCDVCGTLP